MLCFSLQPYFEWNDKPEWVFGEDSQNLKTKEQN
jgi:hypothetical protein